MIRFPPELAITASRSIGQIQTAIGSVTVIRAGVVVEVNAEDHVYQGDVIETGVDGAIGIIFTDGTTFNLSSSSHMVLDEFVCEPNGIANSALFSLARGMFTFLAGTVAATGNLTIVTPVARIRGAAGSGGMGIVTLAAFIFSIIRETQAAWVDPHLITYQDLDFGTYELTAVDGTVHIVGDPELTTVVRLEGSIVSVETLRNTSAQMFEGQTNYQAALVTFLQGQNEGPGSTKASGSGGGFFDTTTNMFNPLGFLTLPQNNNTSNNPNGNPTPPGGPPNINITLPAIIQVLPISHDPHQPVYLGPTNAAHPATNYALNIIVPGSLVSITISGLPSGDKITDGNGNDYFGGGGDITISGTNFYSGLTLSGSSSVPITLKISATVDGPGGVSTGAAVDLFLTVDLVGSPRAVPPPLSQYWINSGDGVIGMIPRTGARVSYRSPPRM